MSDAPDSYALAGGRYAVGANRLALLGVVLAGKAIDAASTVTVLSLRQNVHESMWLTRTFMRQFGTLAGVALTGALAVAGVALLAESGTLVARLTPDGWTPDRYPAALRVVTYCSAGVWYGCLGVHNLTLLF